MSRTYAPIVLFVYNRLLHTKQTVEALLQNSEAAESDIYIYSDGAKNEKTEQQVAEVRSYLKTIAGFKSVTIVEQKQNLGLAGSVISGVSEVVNKYGKVIVLEDDLLTSPYFLKYMNNALNLYNYDDKVISIHAYVYPIKKEGLPDTFFIRGADCWGWATWKRGWDLFEPDGEVLLNKIKDKHLERAFDFDNTYPYVSMLHDQIEGKISSWAIRWHASAFLNNKLTLYPKNSLVENIGFDNSGTHCGSSNKYDTTLYAGEITLDKMPAVESKLAYKRFKRYFVKNKFYKQKLRLKGLKKYIWKLSHLI